MLLDKGGFMSSIIAPAFSDSELLPALCKRSDKPLSSFGLPWLFNLMLRPRNEMNKHL